MVADNVCLIFLTILMMLNEFQMKLVLVNSARLPGDMMTDRIHMFTVISGCCDLCIRSWLEFRKIFALLIK